jgi:hypothetical protein
MNIFYLHHDPKVCAEMHTDKHCIKMILEYAQLLSTAHRVCDGTNTVRLSVSGRKQSYWLLDDARNSILYSATHVNHPSAIWCRAGIRQYNWLHSLLVECCKEYTYRYGKTHKVEASGLLDALATAPKNIPVAPFTEPTPAMPNDVKVAGDSIASYRKYYIHNKQHLASWKGKVNSRNAPDWFQTI